MRAIRDLWLRITRRKERVVPISEPWVKEDSANNCLRVGFGETANVVFRGEWHHRIMPHHDMVETTVFSKWHFTFRVTAEGEFDSNDMRRLWELCRVWFANAELTFNRSITGAWESGWFNKIGGSKILVSVVAVLPAEAELERQNKRYIDEISTLKTQARDSLIIRAQNADLRLMVGRLQKELATKTIPLPGQDRDDKEAV